MNSMVSLYASIRIFVYVGTSGLVPAYKYKKLSGSLLKLRAISQEPPIKAGTLGKAIEKPWARWSTAFKI